MFIVNAERLIEGLEGLRRKVCAYGPDAQRCDCKFGVRYETSGLSEQTGCPELRQVIEALRALGV